MQKCCSSLCLVDFLFSVKNHKYLHIKAKYTNHDLHTCTQSSLLSKESTVYHSLIIMNSYIGYTALKEKVDAHYLFWWFLQIAQPDRVMGICLIHCTGTTAGFMESLKDKVLLLPALSIFCLDINVFNLRFSIG